MSFTVWPYYLKTRRRTRTNCYCRTDFLLRCVLNRTRIAVENPLDGSVFGILIATVHPEMLWHSFVRITQTATVGFGGAGFVMPQGFAAELDGAGFTGELCYKVQ